MNFKYGKNFCLELSGDSHSLCIEGKVTGIPSGVLIDESKIRFNLKRRRPSKFYESQRSEQDDKTLEIEGLDSKGIAQNGWIKFRVKNNLQQGSDYKFLDILESKKILFRPSHCDYPFFLKYGSTFKGGGVASGRETVSRVVAGTIANEILSYFIPGYESVSFVESIGDMSFFKEELNSDQAYNEKLRFLESVDKKKVVELGGFLDSDWMKEIEDRLKVIKESKDSLGGCIGVCLRGLCSRIGEPIFSKLDSRLAGDLVSIPGCKGVEIGAGFLSSRLKGSLNNDFYELDDTGKIKTKTNHSGGILGGVSTGGLIYLRASFKPASSIGCSQPTISFDGSRFCNDTVQILGRHDCCYVPRACVVVESVVGMGVMDLLMEDKSLCKDLGMDV